MNTKEMIVSVITAMVVVAMFASTAAAISIGLSKESVNGYTFDIGDTINYEMTVTNYDTAYGCNLSVTDTLPNGTTITLDSNLMLGNATGGPKVSPTYKASYVVVEADIQSDGRVWNTLTVSGENDNKEDIDLSIVPKNPIRTNITLDFTYEATGCMEVKFTGSSTGSVDWHRWNFGDGTLSPEISGAPNASNAVTHTYTSCDDKTVKLYGESITGEPNDTVQTVHVACKPIVHVGVNPGCVANPGDSATFSVTSLTNDTPIDTYEWTFTNGVLGSGGVLQWPSDGDVSITRAIPAAGTTATLTVTDKLGCSDTRIVSVSICPLPTPPPNVPILTPAGLLALIGLLGIVGGSRILRRGRRS